MPDNCADSSRGFHKYTYLFRFIACFLLSEFLRVTQKLTMGRVFLEHIGGRRVFTCANCSAPLTNRSELISTRFTGATGRAFLFNKVTLQQR